MFNICFATKKGKVTDTVKKCSSTPKVLCYSIDSGGMPKRQDSNETNITLVLAWYGTLFTYQYPPTQKIIILQQGLSRSQTP